jgi:hypothetical protein
MSNSASVQTCRVVRSVQHQSWRGTPTAKFEREDGFFLVECWFEEGIHDPRMQIRSGANGLEEAGQVQIALGLAIDWFAEVMGGA